MLAVSLTVVVGTASTASAEDPLPAWPTFTANALDCQAQMIRNDPVDGRSTWIKFVDWVNPWSTYSALTGVWTAGVVCAIDPAVKDLLAEHDAEVAPDQKLFYETPGYCCDQAKDSTNRFYVRSNVGSDFSYLRCIQPSDGNWKSLVRDSDLSFFCQVDVSNGLISASSDFASFCGVSLSVYSKTTSMFMGYLTSFTVRRSWFGSWHGLDADRYGVDRGGGIGYGDANNSGDVPEPFAEECIEGGVFDGFGDFNPGWYGDGSPWSAEYCGQLQVYSDDDLSESYFDPGDKVTLRVGRMRWAPVRDPEVIRVSAMGADGRYDLVSILDGVGEFEYEVGDLNRAADWSFELECEGGSSRFIAFDPTGKGGPPGWKTDHVSFTACIAEAEIADADGIGDVPRLVGQWVAQAVKCVARWAVTPNRPLGWHIGRIKSISEGTAFGDMTRLVTQPVATVRSRVENRSGLDAITLGDGKTIDLPALGDRGKQITAGLRVLIALGVVLWAVRTVARSFGFNTGD